MGRPQSDNGHAQPPRIVIVGAGFGGIALAIRLREAGIESFTILEKADRVGGVWRDNTYPGLTCDIPSHLYSFSFEPNPTGRAATRRADEILAYLERCVDQDGLARHIRARDRGRPRRLRRGGGALARSRPTTARSSRPTSSSRATGQLVATRVPRARRARELRGPELPLGRWDHDVDLAGKRVARGRHGRERDPVRPRDRPRGRAGSTSSSARRRGSIPKNDRPYRSSSAASSAASRAPAPQPPAPSLAAPTSSSSAGP